MQASHMPCKLLIVDCTERLTGIVSWMQSCKRVIEGLLHYCPFWSSIIIFSIKRISHFFLLVFFPLQIRRIEACSPPDSGDLHEGLWWLTTASIWDIKEIKIPCNMHVFGIYDATCHPPYWSRIPMTTQIGILQLQECLTWHRPWHTCPS